MSYWDEQADRDRYERRKMENPVPPVNMQKLDKVIVRLKAQVFDEDVFDPSDILVLCNCLEVMKKYLTHHHLTKWIAVKIQKECNEILEQK